MPALPPHSADTGIDQREREKIICGLGVQGLCAIRRCSAEHASLVSVTRGVAGMDVGRVDTILLGLPPWPNGALPRTEGMACTSCRFKYAWQLLRNLGSSGDSLNKSWQKDVS